ncbi:hypothetical protein Pfo_001218 [Paulownia fortunei]|nr:hypothetical protein Pfo_001218 [Paulownia fortunei]
MSTQYSNDDASDLQEVAAAEEVLKLEEEVQQMAENILEYRTTLPDQLSSTLSSFLASQRPFLQTRLVDEGPEPEARMLYGPDSEAGVSQGLVRNVEQENMALSVTEDEKIQLLNHKISSNASMLLIVLKRMEEYMARIDKIASPSGIIHPAFRRKLTS